MWCTNCLILILFPVIGIAQIMEGYVEVEILNAEQTFGDTKNFLDWTSLKVRKINKTRRIVGSVTYHVPIDDSYMLGGVLYKKQGGEYRLMPYKMPKRGFCAFYNNEKYFIPDLAKNSEFTYPTKCPVEVGTYKVFGYELVYNDAFFMIQNGEYAAELTIEKNDKLLFAYRIYGSVIKM